MSTVHNKHNHSKKDLQKTINVAKQYLIRKQRTKYYIFIHVLLSTVFNFTEETNRLAIGKSLSLTRTYLLFRIIKYLDTGVKLEHYLNS